MVSMGFEIYAEIGVYHPEYLISGLVDILFVKGDEFFILDWKTNKAPIRFEISILLLMKLCCFLLITFKIQLVFIILFN